MAVHNWRTRPDPFQDVWEELRDKPTLIPGLQARTLFEDLQRRYPGRFCDSQIRTLQRRIKNWRATEGPPRQVYFPQQHHPGELCALDFTDMGSLRVTIGGDWFPHLIYHFVLTYSNWQTGTLCYTENFESLSEGFQNAVWTLGGVPRTHRTDRLSAAVHKDLSKELFTARYSGLLGHYGMRPPATGPDSPHQNGDVEQSHYRLKQVLLMRGGRDFESRQAYWAYLEKLFEQLNYGCQQRFGEELELLGPLPARRLDSCKVIKVRVRPSSTIRVAANVYSVDSRLIGETVQVRLTANELEIWYGRKRVEVLPRLRGEGGHRIAYRHIIDWLVRKPGAFQNYRYRQDLYPTHRFRMAYDQLKDRLNGKSTSAYLQILEMAARQNQDLVDQALRALIDGGELITVDAVRELLETGPAAQQPQDVAILPVELSAYDELLTEGRPAL